MIGWDDENAPLLIEVETPDRTDPELVGRWHRSGRRNDLAVCAGTVAAKRRTRRPVEDPRLSAERGGEFPPFLPPGELLRQRHRPWRAEPQAVLGAPAALYR